MYKEIFSQRLRQAREKTGFTQKEIADELRIARPTIANYETGNREPDIETLGRMAEFYNVSIDWLVGLVIRNDGQKNYINDNHGSIGNVGDGGRVYINQQRRLRRQEIEDNGKI